MKQVVANLHAGSAPSLNKGVLVRAPWQRNVLTFLMVFGPGLIVMEADYHALDLAGLHRWLRW